MEWISVKDANPTTDHMCLVCNERGPGYGPYISIYQKGLFKLYNPGEWHEYPLDVTHWLLLPEIPNKGK